MRTGKAWIAVAVAAALVLAATAAVAYVRGSRDARRFSLKEDDYRIGFRACEQCGLTPHDLGLSGPQALEYRAIGDAARPELVALRNQIRETQTDLLELLRDGGSDTAGIASVLGELAPLQATLERKTVDYILRLRTVLTDRQVAEYDRIAGRAVCPWL